MLNKSFTDVGVMEIMQKRRIAVEVVSFVTKMTRDNTMTEDDSSVSKYRRQNKNEFLKSVFSRSDSFEMIDTAKTIMLLRSIILLRI